ncbi:hypothetical protein Clacol_004653 [Clathrus columnatus]|uniref:Uncharacterized protein n=1 Tax=Clathrus columnatus TaxID=1419009 RepID=A0AAV5A734_9AGAM|nr:hypothetical protein Clacol_004653 [Clathrus columnatus]
MVMNLKRDDNRKKERPRMLASKLRYLTGITGTGRTSSVTKYGKDYEGKPFRGFAKYPLESSRWTSTARTSRIMA